MIDHGSTRVVQVVVVGAGNRGFHAYGAYARTHPAEVQCVAVVEPDDERRERFAEAHGIARELQLRSWEELVDRPQIAQAAINTTMDRTHHPSTLALLRTGYDVLLEKPMATSAAECVEMVQTAGRLGRILQICHVLRYAPFFRKVYDVVTSGRLGDIVSFQWNENLVYWHFAHSFVRGRWANSNTSAPMILTKCCHDLDLIVWMLGRPHTVMSNGSLSHFGPQHVNADIPERCTDGCPIERECPYYAPRIYIENNPGDWARDPVSLDHSPDALRRALEAGPYGRCVFRSSNNVVDHQVVVLGFDGGLNATLTMQGASHVEGRTLRIDGLRATLFGNEARSELQLHDHRTGESEILQPTPVSGGHGGGDAGVMHAFLDAVRNRAGGVLTSAADSLLSHLLAFAAEEARTTQRVVRYNEFAMRFGA
jgi:predicted dehydrogenase